MNSGLARSIVKRVDQLQSELIGVRRDVHMHPELGFNVKRTSAIVAEYLKGAGIETLEGVGRTGVVGIIHGAKPGPVVALRADLDALPIQERGEAAYRSCLAGMMHACGHDLHTVCLLGASRAIADHASDFPGVVKLIFQPAEETDQGAYAMIEDGVLTDPPVDAIFGLHNFPGIQTGCIAVSPGPMMASIDSVHIRVRGKSSHGALPHQGIDALLAACNVVVHAQSIVSRSTDPMIGNVITIGTMRAGSAANIIADFAEMEGSIRTLDPSARESLSALLERVARQICNASGARCDIDIRQVLPLLSNDNVLAELVQSVGTEILGADRVLPAAQTMGGDDFALYMQHVPGCYFWLGATEQGVDSTGWHCDDFDIDESAIRVGSILLANVAIRFLSRGHA